MGKIKSNKYAYDRNKNILYAIHNYIFYHTKLKESDLPEWYCPVDRRHNYIYYMSTKGIVDIKYRWVKENHFIKDSVLIFSYDKKIVFDEKYYIPVACNSYDYVFDYKIFDFLAYIKHFSPECNISEVKEEFIIQCNWLKEHYPSFAPKEDFSEYFDKHTDYGLLEER